MKQFWSSKPVIACLVLLAAAMVLLPATSVRSSYNFNDRYYHDTQYVETVPATIPATAESLWTTTVWLEEITLTNTSADAVTVTVSDRQTSPMAVLSAVSIAANTSYAIRFSARYCPNGVTWVASTGSVVVGYVRAKK